MGSSYNPLSAPGYIAGTVTFAGGTPQYLLALIIAQLEPNCSGAALMVSLQADPDNVASVFVGASSKLGGPLSATNYGYEIVASGSGYKSSAGAGNSSPIAALQVFSESEASLHVEIFS